MEGMRSESTRASRLPRFVPTISGGSRLRVPVIFVVAREYAQSGRKTLETSLWHSIDMGKGLFALLAGKLQFSDHSFAPPIGV
jgi:hypothetical protein